MSSKNSSAWCGAINCSASKHTAQERTFHRFPAQAARARRWVQLCRRADLVGKTPEYLNKNVKLCSAHFEQSQFFPGSKQLKRNAEPTLFDVPNPPRTVTPKKRRIAHEQKTKEGHAEALTPACDWGGVSDILAAPGSPEKRMEGEAGVDQPPLDTSPTLTEKDAVHALTEEVVKLKRKVASQNALLNRHRYSIRRLKALNKTLNQRRNPSTEDALKTLQASLPQKLYQAIELQVKLGGKEARGRRYSDRALMEWLAVYYMGPRAYLQLRRILMMPSPRVLRKRIQHIQTMPGFQDMLISAVGHKLKTGTAANKMVMLMFDEMQLTPKLTYLRGDDCLEGTEDFGSLGKTTKLANHALTFMVRSVGGGSWKQPVGFCYSAGTTKAATLEQELKTCIRKLTEAGVCVAGVVCDMAKTNQELFGKRLGVSAEHPYFEVDGLKIIAMYDPPHLIKCLRNCLFKHDVEVDGNVMSWSHIKQFYELDQRRTVRAAPRLKEDHVMLGAFKKMKVKFATQVCSRSVACGMLLYADFGLLDPKSKITVEGLQRLNDVFDVLNSSLGQKCQNRRPFSKRTEASHSHVLTEVGEWLSRWRIGGSVPRADSIQGMQLTIRAVLLLWDTVKDTLTVLSTRRLCQDALENFFGVVRQASGGNFKPDPTQFRRAFRKSAVNNVLQSSENGNCEADADCLLAAMTSVAARVRFPFPETAVEFDDAGVQLLEMKNDQCGDAITMNVLTYISGYLVRKGNDGCGKKGGHQCAQYDAALTKDTPQVTCDRETLIGLKSFTGVTDVDVGSLKVPSDRLYDLVSTAYSTVRRCAKNVMTGRRVLACMMDHLTKSRQYEELHSQLCARNCLRSMFEIFLRMLLYRMCAQITAASRQGGAQKQNRRHAIVSASAL